MENIAWTYWILQVVYAIVILVVGWLVAKWVRNIVRKQCEKSPRIDSTLTPILAKMAWILVLAFTVIAVLQKFGVQTASLVAVVGALGLAIGLAWQGVLGDFASGFMLLILRPLNVGDSVIIGDIGGTVQEISLVVTKVNTFDNVAVIMPNSKVWGQNIKNLSANDTRRVDMVFGFGYDDDMDHAMRIAKEVLGADGRVLSDPEPTIAISELAGSSVNMIVRPWTKAEDYWGLQRDVTKRMKERLEEEGLNIPYPQRDVHFFNAEN